MPPEGIARNYPASRTPLDVCGPTTDKMVRSPGFLWECVPSYHPASTIQIPVFAQARPRRFVGYVQRHVLWKSVGLVLRRFDAWLFGTSRQANTIARCIVP